MDAAIRTGLVEVPGPLRAFASPGLERRAREVVEIAASSYDDLAKLLDQPGATKRWKTSPPPARA